MALKYGDAVVYVKKSPDGKISRVNAIVLSSALRVPTTADRKPVKGASPVEHVDLAFPENVGQILKVRHMDAIFKPAYDQAPWADGKHSGWEPASAAAVAGYQTRIAELEAELEASAAAAEE